MAFKATLTMRTARVTSWMAKNPCPQTGTGERLVHRAILSCANTCALSKVSAGEAADFIRQYTEGCGRTVTQREINEAISEAYNTDFAEANRKEERVKAKYRQDLLEAQAARVGEHWTAELLQSVSPIDVSDVSPAEFLWYLYEPGERVFIGTIKNARKPSALYVRDGSQNFECLDNLKDGHDGVWFLNNPITGEPVFTEDKNEWFPNGEKWRTEDNVTAWRYMVIESDKAPSELWIRMLVQLELKVVAIYTSGSRSIHALVRIDQPTKDAWDSYVEKIEDRLIQLGADPICLTAVRLTRLPGCMRNEPGKEGMQTLLYLNPGADGRSILQQNMTDINEEELPHFQAYLKEAERIMDAELGAGRSKEFQALTDDQFEELLKELAGSADLVADENNASEFPINIVPGGIKEIARAVSDYAKVPVSVAFLAVVAVLSSAIGRNLRIQSGPMRWTPANLYTLIFVSSGVAKSEVFRHIAKPLTERHRIDRENFIKNVQPEIMADLDKVKLQIDCIIGKAKKKDGGKMETKDSLELRDLYKEKAKLEHRISPPEYYAEDYTIEALGQILSRNGEQLSAMSPEAAKPIRNLKGLYKDGNAEDTIYNKAYSLEAGKIDRVNRQADEFHEPCMSILWMTQPDKIPLIFDDDGLVKGGLAPRFITLHESCEIQEIGWDTKAIDAGVLNRFNTLFNELFDAYRLGGQCEPAEEQDEDDAFEMPWKARWQYAEVKTSAEVGKIMVDHYNSLVRQRNAELQDIQQFLARWTENAWRLALVFHAVKYGQDAHNNAVEAETCKAALTVMEWFSNAQIELLNRGRSREDKLEADVAELFNLVDSQDDKRMTFGKLKDRHCKEPAQLRQLVEKSKGKLKIEESGKTKKKFEVVVA